MTNSIPQKKGGLRTGTARAFAAASVLLLAACDLSTGDLSEGINQFERVRNPVGHLQGIVVDSNGRPLEGATVTIGAKSTTTNAAGSYEFRDIEVVNATNTTGDGDDTDHNSLMLVVTPPGTGHMGAIVRVYPEAQFNNPSSNNDEEDQAQVGSQSIFVDGFRIQVDTATLPELTSTVEILALRDIMSGQPLASVVSTLDFTDIRPTGYAQDESEDEDNEITYPTANWSATTNASGNVTFSNVPANSEFRLHLAGYSCESDENQNDGSGNTCEVRTNNETNRVTYGNFFAMRIVDAGDTIAPTVTSVTGVKAEMDADAPWGCDPMGDYTAGLLNRGIDGTSANGALRFNTSETIMPNNDLSNSVVVFDHTAGAYVTTGTATVSGSAITVATTTAIPEGSEFSAFLFTFDFMDLAGNALAETDKSAGYVCMGDANWSKYLEVALHTFSQPATNPDMPNNALQEEIDPLETGDNNDGNEMQTRSVAFNDVIDAENGSGDFSGFADDDGIEQLQLDPFGDVSDALELLARGFGYTLEVATRGARVSFDPDAEFTELNVYVNGILEANLDEDDFDTNSYTSNTCVTTGGACQVYSVFESASGNNALVIGGASLGLTPGDTVTLAWVDDFGNEGMSKTVTLVDNVEPTVGLQRSYQNLHDYDFFNENNDVNVQGEDGGNTNLVSGCWVHDPNNVSGEAHAGVVTDGGIASIGDGGELSNGGQAAEVGDVCLGVSPELMVDSDGDVEATHAELEAGRDADYDDQVDTTVENYLPRAYDKTAFENWVRPDDIRIGVSFTENLATGLNGTPAYEGTANLSDFSVLNDAANSHLNSITGDTPLVADLVTTVVDDVLAMANDDHGAVLDFTGVVSDVSGNQASAGAQARVVVRDQWPPYVTDAYRDSEGNLVIVFNEPVVIDDTDLDEELEFSDGIGTGSDLSISLAVVPFTQSVDGMTITLEAADLAANAVDLTPVFANTDLTYDDVDDDNLPHALLDFRNISDVHGNSWFTHRTFYQDSPFGLFDDDDSPIFLVQDLLGPFNLNFTSTGFQNASGDFTFTIDSNHSVANWLTNGPNFDALFDGTTDCAGDVCDADFVLGVLDFTDTSCAPVNGAGTFATFSADDRSVVFTVDCGATTVTTGDTIRVDVAGTLVDPAATNATLNAESALVPGAFSPVTNPVGAP